MSSAEAIPIPPFIATLESDLEHGLYDVSVRAPARANLRLDLQLLRAAAGRVDKREVQRFVRLIIAAFEHEKGLMARELDELMLIAQPEGEP